MVIDTEPLDMDAPWEPEGTEKLVVGARVRFRMGERIPPICPECKQDAGLESYEEFRSLSGCVFEIDSIMNTASWQCPTCRHKFRGDRNPAIAFRYLLRHKFEIREQAYHAFGAAAIELTLVEEPDEQ